MKLFLFFIGSSFAAECFKCKATAIDENQVATTAPTSKVPSIGSGLFSNKYLSLIGSGQSPWQK